MKLGQIELADLRRDPETSWFQLEYDLFSFKDPESYRKLREVAPQLGALIEIHAFIGVWCGDTQDQLPGFVRILDALKFPMEQLKMYSLDRAKTFPGGEERVRAQGVVKVPTFIFLKEGREIGRIVETPKISLLADLARIWG